MKILLLTTHLNAGGITSYLFHLSKGLAELGHEVFIASSSGNRADDFRAWNIPLLDVNIHTKSECSLKIYLALYPLVRFVKEYEIDVIHAQTRVTQVLGQLLKKITKKPYISTCHGFFKTRLIRRVLPLWGDRVIAISPAVKDHLEHDFRVPSRSVALIKSGIDVNDFPPLQKEEKENKMDSFGITSGPVIGIIGRLSQEKGHCALIKAMVKITQKIPNAKLVIVGQGRIERDIKNLVEELGLECHVLFFDAVNRSSEFLSVFDIFVMPSTQEGLGLSVMEAQASGLPVVATRVGGLPSLIRHEETGMLVEPNDVEGLARAVLHLLLNPLEAERMGRRAREFIKKECSYLDMAHKTLMAYEEVIGKEPG